MIGFEIFMMGLLITSTLTGLATEALKKTLTENHVEYKSNTLAGLVSLVISLAIGMGYSIFANIAFTSQLMVCIVALVFMSWLCAMIGYDKVVQAIAQFKTNGKDEDEDESI